MGGEKAIIVGVIDKKALKKEKSSRKAKQAFSYYSNGYICPTYDKEGDGFSAGNILEVIVDLKTGKIAWRVDGYIRATIESNYLKTDTIFVPYMEMYSEGDAVEWMGCS